MIAPHWQLLHEWKLDDIKFDLEQIWAFKKMLVKHPDDKVGDTLREIIKDCKKHLSRSVDSYEKIYGGKPNVAKMRREVEDDENNK